MKRYVCIIMFMFSCKTILHKKGVYVRIINVDTVETKGYTIEKSHFPGLKPGDTSEYIFFKKLNAGDEIGVSFGRYIYTASISCCRHCDIDTPKHITMKIKVVDKNLRVPRVIHEQ